MGFRGHKKQWLLTEPLSEEVAAPGVDALTARLGYLRWRPDRVQALPASPLHFMAAPESTQGPLCNVCAAWLLPRGAGKLSPACAPVTIPNSWCVSPEMQMSGASSLPQGMSGASSLLQGKFCLWERACSRLLATRSSSSPAAREVPAAPSFAARRTRSGHGPCLTPCQRTAGLDCGGCR